MKLRVLLEALTSKVYHATTYGSAISILRNNIIKLSSNKEKGKHKKVEGKESYPYFLSLARTSTSSYIKDTLSDNGVVLEFDGNRLNQNFKGMAVDWHGNLSHEKRKGLSLRFDTKKVSKEEYLRFYEAEDRLFSKKPSILNARKFIKAVHVLEASGESMEVSQRELKEVAKEIPVFIYNSLNDFIYMKKTKAVSYK